MRKLVFSALLGLAAVSGCSKDKATGSESADKLPTMALDDVEKGLAAGELTAIDCNGTDTRKKHGVIDGAVLIADEETYAASELPADKGRKLVFYCSGPT
ncbi:MAG TPA: hypothetical protein VIV11_40605 [Kofleriaceae bacterium]